MLFMRPSLFQKRSKNDNYGYTFLLNPYKINLNNFDESIERDNQDPLRTDCLFLKSSFYNWICFNRYRASTTKYEKYLFSNPK